MLITDEEEFPTLSVTVNFEQTEFELKYNGRLDGIVFSAKEARLLADFINSNLPLKI